MPVNHIVWDWNGTLFDDGDALVTATADAFRAVGLPAVTRARYRACFTRPITDFYDQLAGRQLRQDEQDAVAERFQQRYEQLAVLSSLAPGALAAVTAWHAAGRTQSLLSMYPVAGLRELVTRQHIDRFFVRVDGLPGHEPGGKEAYLRQHLAALAESAVRPAGVLVVGDNADDVAAARACGVACVLYHPGDSALIDLARANALAATLASDLNELVTGLLATDSVETDE
jgi:phosphoglycolate phosphatase-like HAD superfamily hydrolase